MSLKEYRRKRDFRRTPEPRGKKATSQKLRFVVQKHAANRLHYDFRLECDGVLKSWAVPKGPSLDPSERRLAVQVEDHPVDYINFEGTIPPGEYGGGTVMLWDDGSWEAEGDPAKDLRAAKLSFTLHGKRLKGSWVLAQMHGKAGDGGKNWLLMKHSDRYAKNGPAKDVTERYLKSVESGRTMEQIARDADAVWRNGGEESAAEGESPPLSSIAPLQLSGAKKRSQPKKFSPQLATLVSEPPTGDDWIHEIKFDGYRIVAIVDDGKVKLWTRRGQDWTAKFRPIADAVEQLGIERGIFDGELVVVKRDGSTDFQALQNYLKHGGKVELAYYIFDLPHCLGADLTGSPLWERKQLLQRLLDHAAPGGLIRYSDHVRDSGGRFLQNACRHKIEGMISKQIDSKYVSRRSRSWTKEKCNARQEFLIVGYTDPEGARVGFGALLLGVNDGDGSAGRVVYCGRVGTGFTHQSLQDLAEKLHPLERKSPSVSNPPRGAEARGVHWITPSLIAEVEFAQWTNDGRLRVPSFQGLRLDKKPEDIRREVPADDADGGDVQPEISKAASPKQSGKKPMSDGTSPVFAGVRLSSPEKVLYPELGLTKRQLAEYYASIADHVLPHVIDRPLSLLRCPEGRNKSCFFQKHHNKTLPKAVHAVEVFEKDKKAEYLVIHDLAGLISLVQLGTLEIHPWGAKADRPDRPDQIIFDLDPSEEVAWGDVMDAATLVRDLLDQLGLQSFVRTSGGKGLHLVTPIRRRSTWDDVKDFARRAADAIVRRAPERYIATMSKARRKGKIFIDYLRNSSGATAIASFSARAKPGATVATPLRWEELTARLDPQDFTIETVPDRLAKLKADPWDGFFTVKQSLTKSMLRGL